MNLAIFLALGDSFTDMQKTGQDVQFRNFYLPTYSSKFDKILIFSYANEDISKLPKNIEVVPNTLGLHRYLYALVSPFIHWRKIRSSNVIRAYHITGTVPAIISKIIYNKPFIFNYAFNYKKFAKLEKKYFQLVLLYILEPFAFLSAKRIFIANKKYLNKSKKSIYLPNGVDTDYFKPSNKKKSTGSFKVLSVGRLKRQKNFHTLFESLLNLKVNLTIVGEGPLKNSLIEKARNIKLNLKIINNVSNNKMPNVYNSADIFVLPSLIEGHPKSLLEAMSCALPVICTNVEGSKEIVKDNINGLITEPTAQSMRSSILKLFNSQKLRKKLSAKAREDIIENFDLTNLIQRETNALRYLK